MRTTKVLCAALVAVLLCAALSGCAFLPLLSQGSDGDAPTAAPATEAPAETAPADADPTAAPTEAPTEAPTQEPDEPTLAESLADFTHGTWDGLTFHSDLAGLTLTLPDDTWTIATDEDLAEMMNLGQEVAGDVSKLEQAVAKLTNIQDMMAQNSQTGESIILMFENLAIVPGASDYTAEAFAELLAQGLEENEALPYVVGEISTQTLCGNTYTVIPTVVEEYDLHQHYLVRREGNFMVELILTGAGEDGIDSLLAMFAEG